MIDPVAFVREHGVVLASARGPDVKLFKLVAGKVTLVHRRVWPALVALADELGPDRLAELRQEHTPTGEHRNVVVPYPDWVPAAVRRAAARLDPDIARATLGPAASVRQPRRPRDRRR